MFLNCHRKIHQHYIKLELLNFLPYLSTKNTAY